MELSHIMSLNTSPKKCLLSRNPIYQKTNQRQPLKFFSTLMIKIKTMSYVQSNIKSLSTFQRKQKQRGKKKVQKIKEKHIKTGQKSTSKKYYDRKITWNLATYKFYYKSSYKQQLVMNKSATKKSLYEAPLTSRVKTSASSSSQIVNSFKYEIVIKTTENQVPDIQIIKGIDTCTKSKETDRCFAARILMVLQKKRLRQLRMGFYKIDSRRHKFKQKTICALKIGVILKNKQKNLMKIAFLRFPNVQQLRLKQLIGSKIIGFISSKIFTKNKSYGLTKIKNNCITLVDNSNQSNQIKNAMITQKTKPKQQLSQANTIMFSQKIATLCRNSLKDPSKFQQSFQLIKKNFTQQLNKISAADKKNNECAKTVILQYIIKLLNQAQTYNKGVLTKTLNSILPPAKQQNQSNQEIVKQFERILETFNQCLNQDNYQKWEKFVTGTQTKDNSCNKFFERLDKLNDILAVKIEKAVQVEAIKVMQIQSKLDLTNKQHEQSKQNLHKKIAQLQKELDWHLQQKITKKQYQQITNANSANDRKVLALHNKMQQLLKTVDDKSRQLLKAVQQVQNIERRLANIDGEQINLVAKINNVQNTILGVKQFLRFGIEDEITLLKRRVQQKDAMLNNLTWELQSTKNSFLDPSTPKFQNSHNILGHFAQLDLSDINVKQESERAKLQISELQKQLYNLRLENQTLSQELNKAKSIEPALSSVTSLENVVLLLTNIMSFVNSKFNSVNTTQAVDHIFNTFSDYRINYSENDQMFLQKCENFAVDFIQQHIR